MEATLTALVRFRPRDHAQHRTDWKASNTVTRHALATIMLPFNDINHINHINQAGSRWSRSACDLALRCLLCLGGVGWETGQTTKYESPSTQGSTSIRTVSPPRIRAYGSIDFGGGTETGNRDDADGLLVLLRPTQVTW